MVPVLESLFSDRGWAVKLLLAVLLFAGLCQAHRQAMIRRHPQERAIYFPAPADIGGEVRRWGVPVTRVESDGFQVDLHGSPVTLRGGEGLPPVRPGDRVAFSARLVGPSVLRAEEVAVIQGHAWKRALNYAVSLAVLGFVVWRSRRLFRARPRAGLFQGRT